MRHSPLCPARIAPKLLASHIEDAPTNEPTRSLSPPRRPGKLSAIGLFEELKYLLTVLICLPKPGSCRLVIMRSAQQPVILHVKIALKVEQKCVGRHNPSGKEMLSKPVRRIPNLKRIGIDPMREDVHKEQRLRTHPGRNARHQKLIIPHMLEHLDRNDAIERNGVVRTSIKVVHIRSDDANVDDASLCHACLNKGALRGGVRHSKYRRIGKPLRHVERQRSPSAPKLKNVLTIFDPCSLGCKRQHGLFRFIERCAGRAPKPLAQRQFEETGRHLVVLLVRFRGR